MLLTNFRKFNLKLKNLGVGKFLLALACGWMATSAQAEDITLKGNDAFTALQKMTCATTAQGVPRYGYFEGRVYSRVLGEKDRHLFNAVGINVRHCKVVNDPKRGKGFRSISKEIMVYLNPETNEIVDTWKNPWTGKTVNVMHVANDPVNMRDFRYELDADGKKPLELTIRRYGDVAFSSVEVPLFYDNPLAGPYQNFVGGTYHAMEIFNNAYIAKKLLDPKIESVGQNEVAWSRFAQWLPWFEMGNRPGWMIFNATGFSSTDRSEIPENIMEILKARYPLYLDPPPLDDDRPNETSWTVFKKQLQENKQPSE